MSGSKIARQVRIAVVLWFFAAGFPAMAQSQETIPGSLTQIKQLKRQIQNEKEYSASLRSACEKYYAFMSNHKEGVWDYIDFYKEMMAKTNDPEMKNVFLLRYIRGLFSARDTVKANTVLKEINSSSISIPEEKAYYKLLLTYYDASWSQAKLYFEEAIDVYEKNKISTFELYSLYNNFGAKNAAKDQDKAISLYCRAITLSESFWCICKPIRNIQILIARNPNIRIKAEEGIQGILKTSDRKTKILTMAGLISNGFWRYDLRVNRKYMDSLYTLLESKEQPTEYQLWGWLVLAEKERGLKNFADAEVAYSRCIKQANHLHNAELIIRAKIGKCMNNLRQLVKAGPHFRKEIDSLIQDISRLEERSLTKAIWYAQLAREAIKYGDTEYFDKLADLSNKNDGGISFAGYFSDDLTSKRNEMIDRDSYIKIASKITDSGSKILSREEKTFIAFNLDQFHAGDLGRRFSDGKDKEFVAAMFEIEKLTSVGTHESLRKALNLLNSITPTEFFHWGEKMTVHDSRAWILTDKLGCYLSLNDLIQVKACLEELENYYPQNCSETYIARLGAVTTGNMGQAFVVLWQPQKGIPLLIDALPKVKGNVLYFAYSQTLGAAYMQIGDPNSAIKHLRESAEGFRRFNMPFYYTRSALSWAGALVETNDIPSAVKILHDVEPIIRKNGLKDELARLYQIRIFIIQKDKKLKRDEKIAKILALQRKSLDTTENPTVIANALYIFAKFKYEQNIAYPTIINDIELYFKYQKLFKDAVYSGTILSYRDTEMKDLLFKLLAESDDAVRIDYWNKVFERDRTRAVELQSQQPKADAKMLSLLTLISKFENAQQILAHEQSKKESEQDKLLIQKALKLKREIEQQFELAKKNLSAKDLKFFDALLSDNFIIHPDSLSQMSSILPADTACIQFLNVGEKVIAYIAVKDAPPFTVSISLKEKGMTQKQFSRKLFKVRNLLQSKTEVLALRKDLSELYSVLFAEMEKPLEKLKVKSIVVNASGILRYVPLATLYDGKKYLIEKYQVTNITGLDLIRLSKNSGTRTISDVKAAIFADPDGSLPAGRNEGQNIAKFFANKKLYLGDKASLAEFESMMGNVNFVHLATHAVLDPNEPGKSYIQFADGKKWYYSDMMGFNIQNVDSIALSACETAVSEKSTGGEIEGMAYQLLKKSPSGSVLASFWKVDDTATAMLMSIYYKHVTDSIKANHTLDRGGALREAQLNLLKNPDTSHPYYWAAFTLFGDFR